MEDLVGDGVDQNCDGIDGTDADGDGFASSESGGDDCDDGDPGLNQADGDTDGYTTCGGDCDDADSSVSPIGEDVATDGKDQDCNGVDGPDLDGDGFAAESGGGRDCDDGDPSVFPDAAAAEPELCTRDGDSDGYGDPGVGGGTDCDDADPALAEAGPFGTYAGEVTYDCCSPGWWTCVVEETSFVCGGDVVGDVDPAGTVVVTEDGTGEAFGRGRVCGGVMVISNYGHLNNDGQVPWRADYTGYFDD